MANAAVDTGHGASATFSTTALSFNFTSIDMGAKSIGKVDVSHLASSGFKEYLPEDLSEPGEITIPYQFDSEAAEPAIGTVETLTITLPTATGQSGAGTLAGTGFITNVKRPNLQTSTVQDGSVTFAFDGGTGPAYTPATTP